MEPASSEDRSSDEESEDSETQDKQNNPPSSPSNPSSPSGSEGPSSEPSSWSESQLETLKKHEKYHSEMLDIVNTLISKGPTDSLKVLPVPRPSLQSVQSKGTRTKDTGDGKEAGDETDIRKLEEIWRDLLKEGEHSNSDYSKFTNLDKLAEELKKRYKTIVHEKCPLLGGYIEYGRLVNKAHKTFRENKLKGIAAEKIESKWCDWLKKNVEESVPYINKIRNVSDILANYKKFYKLAVPFAQIYRNKNDLKKLLRKDKEVAAFWTEN